MAPKNNQKLFVFVKGTVLSYLAILAVCILSAIIYWAEENFKIAGLPVYIAFTLLFGGTIAAAGIVVFAIPCHLLLTQMRLVSLPWYLFAGLSASIIVDCFLTWGQFKETALCPLCRFFTFQYELMFITALVAAPFAALVFWKTVRPDMRIK